MSIPQQQPESENTETDTPEQIAFHISFVETAHQCPVCGNDCERYMEHTEGEIDYLYVWECSQCGVVQTE